MNFAIFRFAGLTPLAGQGVGFVEAVGAFIVFAKQVF